MTRLRRFLMLERERAGRSDPDAPAVSSRFQAVGPPEAGAEADRFAPPPEPEVILELEAPAGGEPRRDVEEALAAEIAAMSIQRDEIGVARVEERYARPIDRLAGLVAVGPMAAWSPRARVRLVAGVGVAAIAGLSLVGGVGPRVLQVALGLLLAALFMRS